MFLFEFDEVDIVFGFGTHELVSVRINNKKLARIKFLEFGVK